MVVNGGKKKKKGKKKGTKKTSQKRASAPKTKKRRSSKARRRNPGMDTKGILVTCAAGALAVAAAQTVAHMAGNPVQNRAAKTAVRVVLPTVLGLGGAWLAGEKFRNVSRGVAAAGVGVAVLHLLSAVTNAGAAPKAGLVKVGWGQLGDAEGITTQDGVVFQNGRALFPIDGRNVPLVMQDGSQENATLLAGLGDGESVLVMDQQGRYHVLPASTDGGGGGGGGGDGMAGPGEGMTTADSLGDAEEGMTTAQALGDSDEDDGLGGADDGELDGYVG
jgi:hypothetical protein